jgi:Cu(I)/Ag(I) efflux system membrane fusion protein
MRLTGGATLATVHQLDPIFVQMDFPMERIDSLKVGQPVDVVLDAFPQDTFTGKVTRISPVVSTKTRVLPVIVEVANPEQRIRAGISGFARVKSTKSGTTTVPSVAVIKQQQRAMVVCVEESRAKIREVHTGPLTGSGEVQILDGLNSGDEVIVYGQDAVHENDLVNADWRNWTRRPLAGVDSP